jgi:hypothetical protein
MTLCGWIRPCGDAPDSNTQTGEARADKTESGTLGDPPSHGFAQNSNIGALPNRSSVISPKNEKDPAEFLCL